MGKMLKVLPELEYRERIDEQTENVIKHYKVSFATASAFLDRSGYTVGYFEDGHNPRISVAAFEQNGRWNGLDVLHDEMLNVGLNTADYNL